MEHEVVFPSPLGIPYIAYTSLCHTDSTLLTYLPHQLKASTLKLSTVGVKGERLHTSRLYTAQSAFSDEKWSLRGLLFNNDYYQGTH